ncbi:MAG: hypothetical protein KA712_02870 [Myxococcales bacterium]|nr:hypothetical protein [Myxococcales bacterium]
MSVPASAGRRKLFTLGLCGGVLLAGGGITWVGLRKTKLGLPPRTPLRFFTLEEHAVLTALAACMLADLPAPPAGSDAEWVRFPDPHELDCAGQLDLLVAKLHPETGAELKQLIALFENGLTSLVTSGPLRPFTQLPREAQRARLAAWGRSRFMLLRSGHLALTRLIHATYYASPSTYAAMGYPGPPEVPDFGEDAPRGGAAPEAP